MSIYSLNLSTTTANTGFPTWDMKAQAANLPKIMQVDIQVGQATAAAYGLGRPGNDGTVVQVGPTAVNSDDPSQPSGQTTCALQWTVPPTIPANFHRRYYSPAVINSGVVWTFPRGLGVLSLRGLVMWNLAANPSPVNIGVILDE